MPITLNRETITADQLTALNNVYANVGRTWKSKLINSWSTGNYRDVCFDSNEVAFLQVLRNTLGRYWLNNITTKELNKVWLQYCA